MFSTLVRPSLDVARRCCCHPCVFVSFACQSSASRTTRNTETVRVETRVKIETVEMFSLSKLAATDSPLSLSDWKRWNGPPRTPRVRTTAFSDTWPARSIALSKRITTDDRLRTQATIISDSVSEVNNSRLRFVNTKETVRIS